MALRKPLVLPKERFRSALTNGRDILADIDGRSAQARRFRDLFCLYGADLGGADAGLSEGQLALARRASCLTVELERLESRFAANDGATPPQLELYQRTANSLRRLIESLGIHTGRKARNITPTVEEYLKHGNGRTIDHEVDE